MNDIRVLIADDDAGMRLILRKYLERAGGFQLVGEAVDGRELIRMNEELAPEVIILDVEMPHLTGVECAKVIQDINPKTILVFATAHEKYMMDAFSVYAFDYLLKPFNLERVMKTLSMIRMRLSEIDAMNVKSAHVQTVGAGKKLMLRHREGIAFADTDDIILIQREERQTAIYLKGGEKLITGESLSDMEEKLPRDKFFRTHKSYIVGLDYMKAISPYGRWTYVIQMRDTEQDALVTAEKLEMIEKMFQ